MLLKENLSWNAFWPFKLAINCLIYSQLNRLNVSFCNRNLCKTFGFKVFFAKERFVGTNNLLRICQSDVIPSHPRSRPPLRPRSTGDRTDLYYSPRVQGLIFLGHHFICFFLSLIILWPRLAVVFALGYCSFGGPSLQLRVTSLVFILQECHT